MPFVFLENSHLQAIARTNAGVESAVALTNHTGAGNVNGGTVRTAVAVPATSTLTIIREVPATQTTIYQEGGDFPAASHERALDKLTQITQQNTRQISNSLRLTEANPIAALSLPTIAGQHVLATAGSGTAPSFQSLASLSIGPVVATGSTTPRNVQDRFADVVNIEDFGAVGDGATDNSAAVSAAAVQAESLKCPVTIPAGTFLINSAVATTASTLQHGELRFGASGSYSDASHSGNAPLKLSSFLKRYASQKDALVAAIKTLFNGSGTNTAPNSNQLMLDCEGIEILIASPIELTQSDIATGSGFLRREKVIANLNLRATGASWSAGQSLFTIRGDQALGNLRQFSLVNCRFDCANIASLHALTVGGYYNIFVKDCMFRNFQADAIRSLGYGDATGNHGLVIDGCYIMGDYSSPTGKRGLFTEDGDVVVRGCMIEYVETGIYSSRGSIKVENNHFSMGSQASSPAAVEVTAPRGVAIIGNDIDGAHLYFHNTALNTYDGTYFEGWLQIQIANNDFELLAANALPAGRGFVTFKTQTASNFISNLFVHGNDFSAASSLGGPAAISFATQGSGTWLDSFVSVINNPKIATVSSGNFPAITRLCSSATFEAEVDASQNLVLRAPSGTPSVVFHDSLNAGTNMPRVQSADHDLQLRVQNGGTVRSVILEQGGAFRPNNDNAQTLGAAANRWSVVYAGTGTINTSDANEKQQIRLLTNAEKSVAADLKTRLRAFKFNNAVETKGELARTHFGIVAQDVLDAFTTAGLDAHRYGLFCEDSWSERPEIKAPDGTIVQEYLPAGSRMGVRYDELFAFLVAAL